MQPNKFTRPRWPGFRAYRAEFLRLHAAANTRAAADDRFIIAAWVEGTSAATAVAHLVRWFPRAAEVAAQ